MKKRQTIAVMLLAIGFALLVSGAITWCEIGVDENSTTSNTMSDDACGSGVHQSDRAAEPPLLPVFKDISWESYRVEVQGHEHVVLIRRYPSPISQQALMDMAPASEAPEPGETVFATNVAHVREAVSVETIREMERLRRYAYAQDVAKARSAKFAKRYGKQKMLEVHKGALQIVLNKEYFGEAVWGDYRILIFRWPRCKLMQGVYRKRSDGRYYMVSVWPEDLEAMLTNGKLTQLFQSEQAAQAGASRREGTADQQ